MNPVRKKKCYYELKFNVEYLILSGELPSDIPVVFLALVKRLRKKSNRKSSKNVRFGLEATLPL